MIGDGRVLGKAIGAIRLLDVRIDILLVGRAKEAFRELRRCLPLRLRRIGIAALTGRRIECNVLNALACGRRGKPLGNFHLAEEVLLAARIRRVVEFFRERVKCCTHEVHIRRCI